MKRIQSIIPAAISAVEKHLLNDDENAKENQGSVKVVASEVNGYISSFGASVMSAGLLPSVIFYSQEGKSTGDRHKIIKCIEMILRGHGYPELQLLQKVQTLYKTTDNKAEIDQLTDKIYDAAIALKLAIRIFPKPKKEKA